jgi:hypothetical protein
VDVKVLGEFMVNCSKYNLSGSELVLLNKGMNYSVSYPHSKLNMMCAVEFVV